MVRKALEQAVIEAGLPRLAEGGTEESLPAANEPRMRVVLHDLLERPQGRGVILFGEQQSGAGTLLRHCFAEVPSKRGVILLHGHRTVIKLGARKAADVARIEKTVSAFLKHIAASPDTAHSMDGELSRGHLREVIDEARPLVVLVHRLELLPEGVDIRLRAAAEEGILTPVVVTARLDQVLERPEHSSLLAVSDAYRLPSLSTSRIQGLFAGILDHEGADLLFDACGGQAQLVEHLGQHLKGLSNSGAADRRTLRDVIGRVRRSPPAILRVWQDELRLLLRDHPECVPVLESYLEKQYLVPGQPGYPPGQADRLLYVAGWVGPVRNGWWGMRSSLHADWAREVLRTRAGGRP